MYQNVKKYDLHLNNRESEGAEGGKARQKVVYADTGRVADSDPGFIIGFRYDFFCRIRIQFLPDPIFLQGRIWVGFSPRKLDPVNIILYKFKPPFLTSPRGCPIEQTCDQCQTSFTPRDRTLPIRDQK